MIPTLFFLFCVILTGDHEVGAIDYCIGGRIGKTNRWLLALLSFPLLVAILPVKSPCPTTIISWGAPLVLLVDSGHGVCCNIFGIWYNRLLINQLWKLICGFLGWVPTRAIFLWPVLFLDISLFATLVTIHIWPGRWPSSISTNISTAADLEVNLLQCLVDILINGHSVCIWKWRLVLLLFFSGSRFPLLWIHKIVVFSRSLSYKGLIGYELLLWYGIHFTHPKFLDKLRNLLVLINIPKT